jgi:hypothetical protein
MANPKKEAVLLLVDNHELEAKAGTVVEVEADKAKALVDEGKADDNTKAVAHYKKLAEAEKKSAE